MNISNFKVGYSAGKRPLIIDARERILAFANQVRGLGADSDMVAAIGGSAAYILAWIETSNILSNKEDDFFKHLDESLKGLIKVMINYDKKQGDE